MDSISHHPCERRRVLAPKTEVRNGSCFDGTVPLHRLTLPYVFGTLFKLLLARLALPLLQSQEEASCVAYERNDVMGREESHLHGTSTLRKGNSYFTGDLFPCFHVDVYLISLVIAPFANAALPTPVSALTWSGIFLSYLPRPCCR